MATTKKSAKPTKPARSAKPTTPTAPPSIKPVKEALTKTSLTGLLAEQTGVDAKSVKAVRVPANVTVVHEHAGEAVPADLDRDQMARQRGSNRATPSSMGVSPRTRPATRPSGGAATRPATRSGASAGARRR